MAYRFLIRFLLALAALSGGVYPAASQGLIRDSEIEQTISMLSGPIFEAAAVDPETIEIYIINDDSINAFVAGGKNIFLNTGLIGRLETPPELQGVIAHELGHITGGHIARRNIKLRNARGPALLGQLIGIAAGVASGAVLGTAILAGSHGVLLRDVLRHSRTEEASADQAALTYLERAKIDPSGLYRVFSRFRTQQNITYGHIDPYTVTHPFYDQRMQLVERRVNESKYNNVSSPKETVYWHNRMRAKLDGFVNNADSVLAKVAQEPETEFTLYAKTVALHRVAAARDAIASVDKLIALRPNDPFYLELKGQILFESGLAKDAVPYYRQADKLAPDEPLIKAGLGRALLALNNDAADAEALTILREARRADMADATALHALATAYSRAGDFGMASLSTAERFALQGNLDDAEIQARRAVDILPVSSPGWLRAQDILRLIPTQKEVERR